MPIHPIFRPQVFLLLVTTLFFSSCSRPQPEAPKQPSAGATATPAPANTPSRQPMAVSTAIINILNKAHRSGSAILHGECGNGGTIQLPQLSLPVTLEPMEQALQEISGKYQNIYWRESRTSIVVADSAALAKLLRVHIREFRVVEDREPDAVMAVLWREPEVISFMRHNNVRFARRTTTANKAISPPMIISMKNATVSDILDRIAAGYYADPPKVWVYSECGDKKNLTIDLQMK